MTDTDVRAEWIAGARALIDFVEATPDLLLPDLGLAIYVWEDNPVARLVELARLLGHVDKVADDYWYKLVRSFGPHKLRVLATREKVCQRVATGTRTVTRHVAPKGVELVEVTETEETFEWVCPPSLLSAAAGSAPEAA